MRFLPSDQERLYLLNRAHRARPWRSCGERRRCIACDRTFRGTAVTIRRDRTGMVSLACPRCQSAPNLWVTAGDPLTDARVWDEWEAALNCLQRQEELAR